MHLTAVCIPAARKYNTSKADIDTSLTTFKLKMTIDMIVSTKTRMKARAALIHSCKDISRVVGVSFTKAYFCMPRINCKAKLRETRINTGVKDSEID